MKSNRGKKLTKTKPVVIGFTEEGEPIIITAQTRGMLDINLNLALQQIYTEYKLPKKAKPFFQLTKEEQDLLKSCGVEQENNSFVTIIDKESKEYIENKTKIEALSAVVSYISYLKMDAQEVELENGNKISHYEDFNLNPSISLLNLAKWFIDKENGLGINDNDIVEYLQKEIIRLKQGENTLGEMYVNPEKFKSKEEMALEKIMADLNEKES